MKTFEGWVLEYLVNALWQVPVVFAAAWVSARLVRRESARMEHRVWVSALLLEVALPACPVRPGELLRAGLGLLQWGGKAAGGEVWVAVGGGTAVGDGVLRLPAEVRVALMLVYGCCVLYFAARLGWGLWKTGALRRQAERVTLTGEAARGWERLARQFGCEAAVVAVSQRIAGPVTVGCRHAALLVPVGFLERVAEPDWEAVMAHEFAHIARRDFLKNLAYGVAMLPLTWHPVAWLTRARVAESREMVCDAMAAEVVAGREGYARSLLRLASLLVKGTPDRTLHAIGIFDANLFERRVMKLTEKRMQGTGARRIVATVACVGLGVVTCGSALALRMEVGAPVAAVAVQEALAGHGPARVSGGVMAGNVLTKVTPVYPPEAKEAKIEGAVVLKAVIGKDGLVNNLQVVSGPKELQRSALDSVRQWKYKPYLLNGEPMEVETTVTVTYSLAH